MESLLIYSFVARGTVILLKVGDYEGYLTSIAAHCLQKLTPSNNKFTYICRDHSFNYLVEDGYTYCVVADKSAGSQIPMNFLEKLKNEFVDGGGKVINDKANLQRKKFGSKMKKQMQNVRGPLSELATVKAKGVTKEVLCRDERMKLLVDKTEDNVPCLSISYQKKLCTGVGDSEYFEGSVKDRPVVVKRIPYSKGALVDAKRERANHYQIEAFSKRVLRLHDVQADHFYIYLAFDLWKYPFGDLVRYVYNKETKFLTDSSVLGEVLKNREFLDSKSKPTPLFMGLIGEMFRAVRELHAHQFLHGAISLDSFYVEIDEHNISLVLGDLSSCRPCGCQTELEEDIFSLGDAFGYIVTRGFGQGNLGWLQARGMIRPEESSLVQDMVQRSITAKDAIQHPFFWSVTKKVRFLIAAPSAIKRYHCQDSQRLWKDIAKAPSKVSGGSWIVKLPAGLQNEVTNEYEDKKLMQLLRYVRNKLVHCTENEGVVKLAMGDTERSVLEFFTLTFPKLLVEVYKILLHHFANNSSFKSEFLEGEA